MKTTKRSKMLLSSIAMLLVALVALGSATYAWYIVNQNVTASTISVAAAAADGLVGKKTNDGANSTWGASVSLAANNDGGSLYPASIDPASKTGMYNAVGTSQASGSYSNSGTPISSINMATLASTNYYIADDYYIKSTGKKIDEVKFQVKAQSSDSSSYLNCLVFVDGTYVGGSCLDGSSNNAAVARKNDGTTATFKLSEINKDCGSITDVTTTARHVQVIVYADGENAKCTNDTAYTQAGVFTVYCYYE